MSFWKSAKNLGPTGIGSQDLLSRNTSLYRRNHTLTAIKTLLLGEVLSVFNRRYVKIFWTSWNEISYTNSLSCSQTFGILSHKLVYLLTQKSLEWSVFLLPDDLILDDFVYWEGWEGTAYNYVVYKTLTNQC